MTEPESQPVSEPESQPATPLPKPYEPRGGVPHVITDPAALGDYADLLAQGSGPLALDAERASGCLLYTSRCV